MTQHINTGLPGHGLWFKSSYSSEQGTDCVEALTRPGTIRVRDSKQNAEGGPVLAFPAAAWSAFAAGLTAEGDEV